MLPQPTQEESVPHPRTIYINPNFNKVRATQRNDVVAAAVTTASASTAHFNPLFLQEQRLPAIHMNPEFLQKKLLEQQQLQLQKLRLENQMKQPLQMQQLRSMPVTQVANSTIKSTRNTLGTVDSGRKIIAKSRTCIVREPATNPKVTTRKTLLENTTTPSPLIKLTRLKLVRCAAPTATASKVKIAPVVATAAVNSVATAIGKYKIDRRRKLSASSIELRDTAAWMKTKRRAFVARYALRRSNSESTTARRKVSASAIVKPRFKFQARSGSKNLQLLNINGVLYRSTGNKLQRKDAPTVSKAITPSKLKIAATTNSKLPHGRTLFVHGTKFVMDKQGYKLTRVPAIPVTSLLNVKSTTNAGSMQRQRIDIGGLTYVASKTQNVFVRTRNHLTLAHLNNAKQRSLQLLTRRLVKSNIPCAIYQRVGKCVAYERGKCNKVHDKRQVIICPRFLRSECVNDNCLLSHNVSLSKMPVCKFFLQGVCVRNDCPYLHKKLSPSAEICEDFLRGFCTRAQQCNKRHEFLCPEYARHGKCVLTNCLYCKSHKRRLCHKELEKEGTPATSTVDAMSKVKREDVVVSPLRYFSDNASELEKPTQNDKMDIDVDVNQHAQEEEATEKDNVELNSAPFSTRISRPKVGMLPAFIPLT